MIHEIATPTEDAIFMVRPISLLIVLACLCLPENAAVSQTASQLRRDRLQGTFDIQNAQIGEQRVQRQTEISRLEEALRTIEDRLTRLERKAATSSPLPLITMAEANAGVEFAIAQLRESERLHTEGKITDVLLAQHRLEHVRAVEQRETSKFAHADRLIALEMEVLYCEQALEEQTQHQRHLERLVAKGYSSSDGLKQIAYDVAIANKQVQQARFRLAIQQRSSGDLNPKTLLESDSSTGQRLPSPTPATEPHPADPKNTKTP